MAHPQTILSSNISTETSTQIPGKGNTYEPMVCAYVLALMSVYWMTEVIHPSVTSLIPIVAFPLFGVLSTVSQFLLSHAHIYSLHKNATFTHRPLLECLCTLVLCSYVANIGNIFIGVSTSTEYLCNIS